MKVKFILVITAVFSTVTVSFGQQSINRDASLMECKIVFDVTYPGLKPTLAMAEYTPTEKVVYLKNDKLRIETRMADGHKSIMLVNNKNKIAYSLTEDLGKKYAVKATSEEVIKVFATIPYMQVKVVDDFKEIAGYSCQKNEYTIVDKDNDTLTANIYVNEKILLSNPNWYYPPFMEVSHFMFEYQTKRNGVIAKFSAKSVEQLKENDSIFDVPQGYKITSKEEFVKLHHDSSN